MIPNVPNQNHTIRGLTDDHIDFLIRKGTWRLDYDPRVTPNTSSSYGNHVNIAGEGPVNMRRVISLMNRNPYGRFYMDVGVFGQINVRVGTDDMNAMIEMWGTVYSGTNNPTPWGPIQSRPPATQHPTAYKL